MVLHKERINPAKGELLKRFHLSVETDLSTLQEIIPWFEDNCGNLLNQSVFLHMQIVLIEGFTNTVKYAHLNLPRCTPIELLINIFEDLIEIKIWDYGLVFDLEKQLQEELNVTNSEELIKKESHRGLLLMNSLTDELYYIHEGEKRNCLVMRRYFASNIEH